MHSHLSIRFDDRVEIDVNRLFFRAPISLLDKKKEICSVCRPRNQGLKRRKDMGLSTCTHRDIVQITTQTHNMESRRRRRKKVGGWIETMNCAVPAYIFFPCVPRVKKGPGPPTSFFFKSTGFLTVRRQCYWPHY